MMRPIQISRRERPERERGETTFEVSPSCGVKSGFYEGWEHHAPSIILAVSGHSPSWRYFNRSKAVTNSQGLATC